jgi:TPR repeat protein
MVKRALAVGAIALLTGCGPSLRADTTDQPKAADATGRQGVEAIEEASSPLIVDWDPEQRGDLEEAITDGVAVVALSTKGMKLLKGCKVSGDYGYRGISTKTQVVRLESAEDVAVNLPLSGAAIAGTIGAEFEQGATLDIAMVMVGKRRTTWADVTKGDLEGGGRCDGATHYVRGITVGAFAMSTGTRQKARAAAEIFGIGASAGAKDSSKVDNKDGKMDACDKADPESDKPPSQCAALLRVELEPIAATASAPADEEGAKPAGADKVPEVKAEEEESCTGGRVWVDGKCTRPNPKVAHMCKPNDAADCKTQCDKGNGASCNFYGVLVARGKASGDAEAIFDKGCKAGSSGACGNLGIHKLKKDPNSAGSTLETACKNGDARACGIAAQQLFPGRGGKTDEQKALRLYTLGCNGGNQHACTNLGLMYSGAAKSIPIDDKKALSLSLRACHGGVSTACGNAGLRYEMGMDLPKDEKLAARLFERACRFDSGDCFRLAILHEHGGGVSKDDSRAKDLFSKTCSAHSGGLSAMSCYMVSEVFKGGSKPVDKASMAQTLTYMQPQCDKKVIRACSFVGVMQLANGDKGRGGATLKKACSDKDAWACDVVKRLGIR